MCPLKHILSTMESTFLRNLRQRVSSRLRRSESDAGTSERQEHPRVPQRVGLHPCEVQELSGALIAGVQQFDVDLRRDGRPVDDLEAQGAEELRLEREAEDPR